MGVALVVDDRYAVQNMVMGDHFLLSLSFTLIFCMWLRFSRMKFYLFYFT
jgi:hypothetical protein